ncbi:DHH family phosphoesterase [Nitrosophilus kaiyonis]|uniref:DHH family phosphoesterase n=1 Tax=Nitrosophilus kaiyonis TaxID=2930200 RepID=UPI002491ABD1|nr:3',5'-cyclic-nucleotide phosphodiesterase [Nitrosophilus kaiyonis]
MKLYHLSHTDLDGYGCQLITNQIFEKIEFFNANYGDEVLVRINQILNSLKKEEKNFILITDLNLTLEESKYLDEKVAEYKNDGYNIELQLLDHHGSGLESAEKFNWYFLDITRSASKITYDFFNKKGFDLKNISKLIDAINSLDIWLENDELFEYGKVLMRLIDEAKEINRYMFPNINISYKHYVLLNSIEYLDKKDGHIILDDNIYKLKKSFFQKDKKDTLDNLVTEYIVEILTQRKDNMSIYYKGHKGILTFGIQNSSIVGNGFLRKNPDFHFFMNINSRGTFSLRANNQMDVSKMAYEIAGGGGHPNASGGKIKNFKEQFIYSELKSFIEELLKSKEEQ